MYYVVEEVIRIKEKKEYKIRIYKKKKESSVAWVGELSTPDEK